MPELKEGQLWIAKPTHPQNPKTVTICAAKRGHVLYSDLSSGDAFKMQKFKMPTQDFLNLFEPGIFTD